MPWTPSDFTHRLPSATWQYDRQVERVVADAGPEAVVVDLGAGGRKLGPNVLCVDFIPFEGTDLVGDVQRLPLRDGSVDLVIGTGLLEHVEDDRALLEETFRVLKPGGVAHFEVPFLQFYHDDPIDNRRFTVPGLARAMEREGLITERSGFHIGPTVALLHFVNYYVAMVLEGRNIVSKVLSNAAFVLFTCMFFWLRYFDYFLKNKRSAHRLAYGVYCTGRKGDKVIVPQPPRSKRAPAVTAPSGTDAPVRVEA